MKTPTFLKTLFLIAVAVCSTHAPHALANGLNAGQAIRPVFNPSAVPQTEFSSEFSLGFLNRNQSGVGIFQRLGVQYAVPFYDPKAPLAIGIDFYLGGELSDQQDDWGSGNLVLSAQYRIWQQDHHRLSASMGMTIPLATDAVRLGLSTPDFSSYFMDAFGFHPGLRYAYLTSDWSIELYSTVDALLLASQNAPTTLYDDTAELVVNYGGSWQMAWQGISGDNLSGSLLGGVEVQAITGLTSNQANTDVWAGPAAAYDFVNWQLKASVQWPVLGDAYAVMQPIARIGVDVPL